MTVPLSERERKILQEIERDLFREDPAFARDVRRTPRFGEGTRLRVGALVFIAGFVTLIAYFVIASFTSRSPTSQGLSLVLGVAAFAAMVGGIVMVVSSLRSLTAREDQPRDRLSQALKRWEARIRERYKGR
jgi:TRAP-type C4-dicarboxylate transport system permease small subunit